MMRREGLEPSRISYPYELKSYAFANFAIPAKFITHLMVEYYRFFITHLMVEYHRFFITHLMVEYHR